MDGASRKQSAKLAGAIFSEHTLPGLPEGLPGHTSAALQLPGMAAEDLPDDLPAEPVVFWLPDACTTPTDPAHALQVGIARRLQATLLSQRSLAHKHGKAMLWTTGMVYTIKQSALTHLALSFQKCMHV